MVKPQFALTALVLIALPAPAAIVEPSGITGTVRVAADEEPAFMLRGEGVQIFECRPLVSDPTRFKWDLASPDATLYEEGRSVGRLTAANIWEAALDRSTAIGSPRSRQDGGRNNLPWVLYRADSSGDTGLFAAVTSIQRVNTRGGVAPESGCDDLHVGDEVRVNFSADYYFYRRRAS